VKQEDKLSEMHKQCKQIEIELHKNHNDSIRHLEAKYMEMMKEEGKIFRSQNWLQVNLQLLIHCKLKIYGRLDNRIKI
jgi:hypothetical protein